MTLHFNLKSMLLFVICLMILHIILPYTFLVGTLAIISYLFLLYKKNNLNACDAILSLSFIFNLYYVCGLSINVRQYDYFNFFMQAVYFVENDFFIKNPISYLNSVYYQPPLWSIITGLITKIGILLGQTREQGFDEARFMSLFSISGVMIVMWRFMNEFSYNKKLVLWGWSLFCFLPIHTIMAGLNNNDSFVYFIMMLILYKGYLWYKNDTLKKAFEIAGLLFVAGMVKFSGLMMIVYLGILGLGILFNKDKKLDAKLWGEFFIIGLGFVLGFAWGIFLLYFGFAIVPPPNENFYQVMSSYTIFERLFDFSNIGVIFADIRNNVIEPNVWLSLIKTSIFGEWSWKNKLFSAILYGQTILFTIFFIYSFLYLLKYKMGRDFGLNLAFISLVIAVFISWALFWIRFPYFCSTEFRYVVILVPLSFLWGVNCMAQKNLPKWANVTLASFFVLFVVAKTIVFVSTIQQF